MKNKIIIIFLTAIVINCTSSAYARKEPTWLFTVPTADTLAEGKFTVGWLHADIGFTNELEIGIHGIKYNLEHGTKTQTGLAMGVAYRREFYVDYPFGHYKRSLWTFDFSPIIGIAYSDVF